MSWWVNFQSIAFCIHCLFQIITVNTSNLHFVDTYSSRLTTNPLILTIEAKTKRTFTELLKAMWSLIGWRKYKRHESLNSKGAGIRASVGILYSFLTQNLLVIPYNCFDQGGSPLICLTLGLIFNSEYHWENLCDLEEVSSAGVIFWYHKVSRWSLIRQDAVTFQCSPEMLGIVDSTCLKIHPGLTNLVLFKKQNYYLYKK